MQRTIDFHKNVWVCLKDDKFIYQFRNKLQFQRIRHYMDWSKNTTQFLVLKEIHSTFLDCFLTTAATSTKSEDDGKPTTQIKCLNWNEVQFHWYVKREQTKKNTFWQIYMTRSGFKLLSQLPICLQPFLIPS